MNTRPSLPPSSNPLVLDVSSTHSHSRFVAATSTGLLAFRSDNCLPTYSPQLPTDGGLAIVTALDDRYYAFVAGGRAGQGKASVVTFWDAVEGVEGARLDFHEPVLGVRLSSRFMIVVLEERSVVFSFQKVILPRGNSNSDVDGITMSVPNMVKALYATPTNPFALACLRNTTLVLPAHTPGHLQIISLAPATATAPTKRVLPAHKSRLRCMALSDDATLLATASEQGTLIRVWDMRTLAQIADLRRGVDPAIVYSLAFSTRNRWLACTSDKGTVHIFDLRPPPPSKGKERQHQEQSQHRKSQSHAPHRLSGSPASVSGHSSAPSAATQHPSGPGSLQEYYQLRPPPMSASPQVSAGISALAAFKSSSFAPQVFKDVRRVASAAFHIGDESTHWQGGTKYSWTVTPNGTQRKVRNPVPSLPNDPSGKPPKGILCFAPTTGIKEASSTKEEEGAAVLYLVGGGSDARWECFDLLPVDAEDSTAGWALVKRGFRKYLTRQFVD